ncbi:MAG: hypothetical protein E6713_12045 [Sporomusaceae bacterium]|nr:hypothetical protein [Sporomusaceae bacterium]
MDALVRVLPIQKVEFQKPNLPHNLEGGKKKKTERFEDILVQQLAALSGK